MKISNRAFWAGAAALLALMFLLPAFVQGTGLLKQRLPSAFVLVDVGEGHGSAVHIGDGYFVTAAHVVTSTGEVRLINEALISSTAQVLWKNDTYDIALLKALTPSYVEAVRLSCAVVPVGTAVIGHGNPGPFRFVAASGTVAGTPQRMGDWARAFVIDGTVVPGMSGGALVDHSGDVVGIIVGVHAHLLGLTGFGIAVPSSVVCDLMGRTS
jgi:S1-C subfamily serine protease